MDDVLKMKLFSICRSELRMELIDGCDVQKEVLDVNTGHKLNVDYEWIFRKRLHSSLMTSLLKTDVIEIYVYTDFEGFIWISSCIKAADEVKYFTNERIYVNDANNMHKAFYDKYRSMLAELKDIFDLDVKDIFCWDMNLCKRQLGEE